MGMALDIVLMARKAPIRFSYGTHEDLVCLGPVNIPLPDGKGNGCYAAKVSTYWLGLPVRKHVESYVVASGDKYYNLREEGLSLIQQRGLLSTPAPIYRFSGWDLVWGHSLGILVGICASCFLAYKLLPATARNRVDELVMPPVITDAQLVRMLSGEYFEVAGMAACHSTRLIVVDPSHSMPIRMVDIDDIRAELAAPGFPDEEPDAAILAEICRAKEESYRLTSAGEINPTTSPYVNAIVVVQAGNKPAVKVVRSLRNRMGV